MKGDFTRLGFDPLNAFTRVLMQQGRVQLDSDWNEWQELTLYQQRAALLDLIATSGVPAGLAGFQVGLSAGMNDLSLSPGRIYVDGVLCENPYAGVTLSHQPSLSLGAPGLAWPATSGRYLAYLEIWERTLSALEVPTIRETALGGPDTTARTRLIWQLRLEAVQAGTATEDFAAGWLPEAFAAAPGQMQPSTMAAPPAGACVLPPGAAYTALSNQLYRVEIQSTGTLNADGTGSPTPTFKWSRDNGSVATSVLKVAGQTLSLADLGPDDAPNAQAQALTFQPGQACEIADEHMVLGGQGGVLLRIASVDRPNLAVTIDPATPVPAVDLSTPVLLRRWDQSGNAGAVAQAVPIAAGPIVLEAGIQVSFQPGLYRAGDYWSFAARTAIDAETGNIVWPSGRPQPPQGIVHNYAPLALVDYIAPAAAGTPPNGIFVLVEDCRSGFAPAIGRFAPMLARYADGARLRALAPGQSISLDKLAAGLMLATPTALDAGSVSPASIQLVAELPVTTSQVLPSSSDQSVVGSQVVVLRTLCSLATPNRIVVTPNQSAQNLLAAALARKLSLATQQDFLQVFTTADFGPIASEHAAWQVGPDGSLQQTSHGVAFGPTGAALAPSLALAAAAPATAPDAIALSVSQSVRGSADVGLVFNWTSNADFWVFYASIFSQSIGFSGGFTACGLFLVHYVNGQPASTLQTGAQQAPTDASGMLLWTADLDVGTSNLGPTLAGTFHWSNGTSTRLTIPRPPPVPAVTPITTPITSLSPNLVNAKVSAIPSSTFALQAATRFASTSATSRLVTNSAILQTVNPGLFVSANPAATLVGPAIVTAPPTYPTSLLAGARIGVMARGIGPTGFTALQWFDAASNTPNSILPIGGTAPVLMRLIAKRTLLRSFAESQAGPGATVPTTPQPDFETSFFVTPAPSGYYGYGGSSAGIGADLL